MINFAASKSLKRGGNTINSALKQMFTIYPIGESHPIQVVGDEKGFRKSLKAGEHKVFTLEVVNIPKETALALCRLADDRGAGRFGWYAHCRGKHMDYNYRKECAREGRRVIDVCTYNGYQS